MPVFEMSYYSSGDEEFDVHDAIYARTADDAIGEFRELYGFYPDDVWESE